MPAIDRSPRPNAAPLVRQEYRSSASDRLAGGIGTAALGAAGLALLLVGLNHVERPVPPTVPLTVTLIALPVPPQLVPQEPERPKPVETEVRSLPKVSQSTPPPLVATPAPAVPVPPSPPTPIRTELQAPPPVVAASPQPPASPTRPASHGPDKWEGRVLARLERFRRYPADAQRARQQGTATIRFRVARDGHVLSASLDRSSGNAALDAAALETVRRADPLPKVPEDRPDTVELVVPIEFSVR